MYTIFRGGYQSKHPKSFTLSRPQGVNNYVILHLRTPALFQINDQTFQTAAKTAIIIPPNTPYQYAAVKVDFQNDWLHFHCPDDRFTQTYSGLFNHPIPLRNDSQFAQYFQHIIWEHHYGTPAFKLENIDMLFQVMLNKLFQEHLDFEQTGKYNPFASSLQDIRLTMHSQPNKNFTPQELAAKMNVSPSYFQHLYKDFFGIPFKKDLIDMRLYYASDLILNTTLTFEQVAYMSGYTNEIHFYRQFKEKTGMTPREYQLSLGPTK